MFIIIVNIFQCISLDQIIFKMLHKINFIQVLTIELYCKQVIRWYIINLMLYSRHISLFNRVSSCFSSAIGHKPLPYTGKPYSQIRRERSYISPTYTHYYTDPFLPVQGYKEFLYDQNGQEYIDLIGGISCMNIGHSHPRITKIYQEEKERLLNLSSHYVNQYQGEYAERLCKQLGHGLDTVFFFNSGSQSNDFAYNLAKAYTKNNTVVALRNGYHGTAGNAYNLTSLGTWNTSLAKGTALQRLAWPNFYRNAHSSVQSLIKDAEEQLDCSTNGKLAGIWLEPIMGAGGVIPLEPKYVQGLHKIVKRMGGLYISDEVQSGFGRIGKQVWGYKWQSVTPDIVIMAKAIANATPFSAVATRRQIADALHHDYFPTFAGGPLECRLGMEVLDIIKEQKIAEHAQQIGAFLREQFTKIAASCKYMGEVRGKGMMIAIQFVKDKESREPNVAALSHVFEQGKKQGVLFGKGGHKGHLIRLLGPLCLSRQSAEKSVNVLRDIASKMQ